MSGSEPWINSPAVLVKPPRISNERTGVKRPTGPLKPRERLLRLKDEMLLSIEKAKEAGTAG